MSVAAPLALRPGVGTRLRALTRSSQAAAGLVRRARILLLAAGGTNAQIGRQVGVSTPTVRAWRNRYDAGGIDALANLERSGLPQVVDEAANGGADGV